MAPRSTSPATSIQEQHTPPQVVMWVGQAERALLLLIRQRRYGKLTVAFRDGLPTDATLIEERIRLGQSQGENT